MTPAEHRQRLFKKSKPDINSEITEKDLGWMYIAAQKYGVEKTYEQFIESAIGHMHGYIVHIIHDEATLDGAKGVLPVGVFLSTYDSSWKIMPHVEWYPWASTRNKLRGTVAWLQKHRHSKEIGIIVFDTKHKSWFEGLTKYIPNLRISGVVRNGFADSDMFIFALRGRKKTFKQIKEMAEVQA